MSVSAYIPLRIMRHITESWAAAWSITVCCALLFSVPLVKAARVMLASTIEKRESSQNAKTVGKQMSSWLLRSQMFIDTEMNVVPALHRSAMSPVAHAPSPSVSLLRSEDDFVESEVYKRFVPTGRGARQSC